MTSLPRTFILLALAFAGCRPPAADLKEEFELKAKPGAQSIDHSLLDQVLKAHVGEDGLVDYAKLKKDPKPLDNYIKMLAGVGFEPLGRDEKLTLLINAYNAFTLALILENFPLKSIEDIPKADRWKATRWKIGSLTLSLDDIEHKYLRPKFKEPRIHFAVNCASIGCPPLRNEAYSVKKLEKQLQEQAVRMHNDKAWLDLDAEAGTVKLTKLYDWFAGDFEQVEGSILAHAAKFNEKLAALLKAGKQPAVEFLDYDWSLNIRK